MKVYQTLTTNITLYVMKGLRVPSYTGTRKKCIRSKQILFSNV